MTWEQFWEGYKETEDPSIFMIRSKFWWMDETGTDGFGPYDTFDEALQAVKEYGEWLNSNVISEVKPRKDHNRRWMTQEIERLSI